MKIVLTNEQLEKFSDYELHLYVGLIKVGKDEDDNYQWTGTNKMWNEYTKLSNMKDKL